MRHTQPSRRIIAQAPVGRGVGIVLRLNNVSTDDMCPVAHGELCGVVNRQVSIVLSGWVSVKVLRLSLANLVNPA